MADNIQLSSCYINPEDFVDPTTARIDCKRGWVNLVRQVSSERCHPSIKFKSIKEQWGELRVDIQWPDWSKDRKLRDHIRRYEETIERLEATSTRTCEQCGNKNNTTQYETKKGIITRCNRCREWEVKVENGEDLSW